MHMALNMHEAVWMAPVYSLNANENSTTRLIVDFDVITDPNTDFILAQARDTQAALQLQTAVTNYGVTVRKSVTAPLMLVSSSR